MSPAQRERLWAAVNAYAEACEGDTGLDTVGAEREAAVADVEAVVAELEQPAQETRSPARRSASLLGAARGAARDGSARFTAGLLYDVIDVLKQHGYKPGDDPACYSRALTALFKLVHDFEGIEPQTVLTLDEAPAVPDASLKAGRTAGIGRALIEQRATDCTCYCECGEDSLSGDWHQHEDELCPVHPDAPVVG